MLQTLRKIVQCNKFSSIYHVFCIHFDEMGWAGRLSVRAVGGEIGESWEKGIEAFNGLKKKGVQKKSLSSELLRVLHSSCD